MVELWLAWLGGLLMGGSVTLGLAYRHWQPGVDDELISFVEVCRAAGRAKTMRRSDENRSRNYADGADAVMAELMAAGYGETPREMRAAYQAAGEDPELDEGEVGEA
jgi:hypothetical protein